MNPNPVCLDCAQPLDLTQASEAICRACGRRYPRILGILDLRGEQASDSATERAIVEKMVSHYPQADFAELLDIRMRSAPTYGDLLGHEIDYALVHHTRGREMIEMFLERAGEYFPVSSQGTALDLGCGSGASLLALASHFKSLVGVDPSMPDLILARKALDSAGVQNVLLVQAYGQRIAFPERSFYCITALNVLEHVFDLDRVLGECRRLLQPGGVFVADSRNRFDLFLPEPHAKIRWVGLMPRRWAKGYVRWRRGVGYEATYLLSYGELRHGLRRHFGNRAKIVFPGVRAYGGPRWVEIWLRRLERLPALAGLVLWIFPSHLALAQRLPDQVE